MDTQKILKKRDKKLKKHKHEKKEVKPNPNDSSDEEVAQPQPQVDEASESDHDKRDAQEVKKVSIVAEPAHTAAEAETKAESKFDL